MPLYEYRCTDCNTEFEELVNASQADDKRHAPRCPKCKSEKTVRILSAATVRSSSAGPGGLGSLGSMGGGCAPSGGFS
ncbi:zinc ribbon domain-containing protein [Oceanidesulfovibrio indonesiensis]|uniref:Zinc ribbon domain-containing protein n=1 Tax=Oceanidesulfovibrio indonesiensis TaxID=54767 RepID=A0A7M3MHL2_9BACT|nr:zinc ribbon domain-containing protein [Oceanidesulfovibrio indonesiensis]TVM18683.1 zinc ribbon domain-containing protein [Oceanidesulfovibrio indonesiensis]